jgi:hypothetical protein
MRNAARPPSPRKALLPSDRPFRWGTYRRVSIILIMFVGGRQTVPQGLKGRFARAM